MKYLILILGLCFYIQIQAQQKSESQRPPWMRGDLPIQTNHSYWFKQMYGEGKTLSEARQNATLALLGDLMKAKGFTVSGNELEQILSSDSNKEYNERTLRDYSYNIEYDQQKISFQVADEYWELLNGNYVCYILYEVANDPKFVRFETVTYTTKYGASALLRSVIVPGWGQMHKRQKAKGIAILGTEIASISGIVISQNLHKSYQNKTKKEQDSKLRQSYQNKSNTWGNMRNGFIVAASAIYIYNIIDVLASKGAKRYSNQRSITFSPFIDEKTNYGISLAVKF